MTSKLKKSAILGAVHETAKDLYDAGVMGQVTMQEFDNLCLQPDKHVQSSKVKQSIEPGFNDCNKK